MFRENQKLKVSEDIQKIWYLIGFTILTSLLRRLQAQTLPDEAPPIGKIYPFTKMALTFEPLMGF